MSIQILDHSPYSIIVKKDGKKYLGFLSMTSQKRDACGYIWNGESMEEWEMKGIIEHNKRKYMYGPWFEGDFLADTYEKTDLETLRLLSEAYSMLPYSYDFRGLHAYGVLVGKKKILILPSPITNNLLRLGSAEDRFEHFDQFNDLSAEHSNISFPLAVLAYISICGSKPFPAKNHSELIRHITSKKIITPKMADPEIDRNVSDFITNELIPPADSGKNADAGQWTKTIGGWIENGIKKPVSEQERQEIQQKRQKLEKSIHTSHKLALFWQHHKTVSIISSVVFVIVLVSLISYIKEATAPPYVLGQSQEQVIRTFFAHFNQVDHITMEKCVEGKAGARYIEPTVSAYVIVKQQMAYEGQSNLLNAEQLEVTGITPADYGKMIWGISDLKLEKLGDLSFRASYKHWYSESEDTENIRAVPIVHYFFNTEEAVIKLVRKNYRYGKGKPEYYLISEMDVKTLEKGTEYEF